MNVLDGVYSAQGWTINGVFRLVNMHSRFGKTFHELEQAQWKTREQLAALRLERLQTLLEYAYGKVPYYRRVMREKNLTPAHFKTVEHLQDFPILTKTLIRENLDDLVAEDFPLDKRILTATGGSTARPTPFYHSPDFVLRARAGALRGAYWTGWRVGKGWARVWGASFDVKEFERFRGRMLGYAQRRLVIPAWEFSDSSLPVFLDRMRRFHPYMIEGYRSSLVNIARASQDYNVPIRPQVVISSAETLEARDRAFIEQVWHTRVFNRYGSREVGAISHECERGNMHVFSDELVVESVLADGATASVGEVGDLLITTLSNWVMPLIRYAIEDRAALSDGVCTCGRGLPLMDHIQGRTADILYLANGKCVDSHHLIKDFPVIEFQAVQTRSNACILRLLPDREYSAEHEAQIKNLLQKALGSDTDLTIERVQELTSTRAGKYRRVIALPPEDRQI